SGPERGMNPCGQGAARSRRCGPHAAEDPFVQERSDEIARRGATARARRERADELIVRASGRHPLVNDDGSVAVGPPHEAGIDAWVGRERLDGDVVVWYGAHFTHDVTHDTGGDAGHIVGPDLRPARW